MTINDLGTMGMNAEQYKAILYPEMMASRGVTPPTMEGLATDGNSLGSRADALWQGVAADSLKGFGRLLAPLKSLTTDMSRETVNAPAGVNPLVHVRCVTGTGGALRNVKDWNQSHIAQHYVPVRMTRHSRPFGLTFNDLMNGETLAGAVSAAVQDVVEDVFSLFVETVCDAVVNGVASAGGTEKVPLIEGMTATAFTPKYVAQTLSCLFGSEGKVDGLTVDPTLYAGLIPHNGDMFSITPGVYGIGEIFSSGKLDGLHVVGDDRHGLGFLCQKRAVVMAARTPMIAGDGMGISVRSLGSVGGVPLLLKSWVNEGSEEIMNSVETMSGFTVAQPRFCRVLSKAAKA